MRAMSQLVVLRETFRSARGTSLDLPCTETNNKVGNEGILCLTRTVRDLSGPHILVIADISCNLTVLFCSLLLLGKYTV